MYRLLIVGALLLVAGCSGTSQQRQNVTYTWTAYDASTHVWTVEKVDNQSHERTQYELTCKSYAYGSQKPVQGPTACNERVGLGFAPSFEDHGSLAPNDLAASFMAVESAPGSLTFVYTLQGDTQQTRQTFDILSAKLIPYAKSSN